MPWKTGKNHVRAPTDGHTGTWGKNVYHGTREKTGPTAVPDETGRAPWKTVKTTGEAPTDGHTRAKTISTGHGQKTGPTAVGVKTGRAPWKTGKNHVQSSTRAGTATRAKNVYDGSRGKLLIPYGNQAKTAR